MALGMFFHQECLWLSMPTSPSQGPGSVWRRTESQLSLGLGLERGKLRKCIRTLWCQEQMPVPYPKAKGIPKMALGTGVTWSNLWETSCNLGNFCVGVLGERDDSEQLLPNQICSCCGNTVKPLYWHWVVVKESAGFTTGSKEGVQRVKAQNAWKPLWLPGNGV